MFVYTETTRGEYILIFENTALMTDEQIVLVQSTFKQFIPIADTTAAIFYERLFELDPSIEPMFKGTMHEQRRKLMLMLSSIVNGLGRLNTIIPIAEDLGRQHLRYGVKGDHYATVGAALLWTLEKGLGEDFTPEVKDAWVTAYSIIAEAAIQGAQ
jgi:nitric oxide dioxygenase